MSPDQWTSVASGGAAVLAFAGTVTRKVYKLTTRIEATLAASDNRVAAVERHTVQLVPNGGSSLADAVRRMEAQTSGMREDFAQIRERLAVVESVASSADSNARNARQAVDGLVYLLPRRSGDKPE